MRESGLQTNCTVSVIMADMSDGEGWTDMETILKQKRQGKNHGLKEVVNMEVNLCHRVLKIKTH